jgi:phage terminase large subunit
VDFGYTNPFVCQWWAIDSDGRAYLYREIYRTRRLVSDHAKQMLTLSQGERIECTLADHDAEDRATLSSCGIDTLAAVKSVAIGIQAVQARLRVAGDGKPRLFILRDSLIERDDLLVERKHPLCTEQEIGSYVWAKQQDGRPLKEEPVKQWDHGMDAIRYLVAHLDGIGAAGPIETFDDELAATLRAFRG